MIKDIAEFMRLGGQTVPAGVDRELKAKEILKFWERVDEELDETWRGIGHWNSKWYMHDPRQQPPRDIPETVDGFIDIAYVALTGAIRLVGEAKAKECWDAVVDANLSKVDGRYGPVVRDEETGKILKPQGWKAPNIEEILNG